MGSTVSFAMFDLATRYYYGNGLALASEKGSPEAEANLANLKPTMAASDIDKVKGWLQELHSKNK